MLTLLEASFTVLVMPLAQGSVVRCVDCTFHTGAQAPTFYVDPGAPVCGALQPWVGVLRPEWVGADAKALPGFGGAVGLSLIHI